MFAETHPPITVQDLLEAWQDCRKRSTEAAVAPSRHQRRDTLNSYLGLMRHGSNYQMQRRAVKAARLLGHSHSNDARKVYQ